MRGFGGSYGEVVRHTSLLALEPLAAESAAFLVFDFRRVEYTGFAN